MVIKIRERHGTSDASEDTLEPKHWEGMRHIITGPTSNLPPTSISQLVAISDKQIHTH